MKKVIIGLVAVIIMVLVLVRQAPEQTTSIGAVLPLTGALAFIGEDMRDGIGLAEKEFGIKVIVSNGEANPQKSISAGRQLIEVNKVPAILTAFRGATLSIASALANSPVIVASITATTEGKVVSTTTPNLFVIGPEVVTSAEVLGSYAKKESLCTLPATLTEQNDPAKDKVYGFTSGITEVANTKLVLHEVSDPSATDWRTNIAKLKEVHADCVFIEVRSNSLPVLLRQFEENKYYPKIFTTSYSFTPAIIATAPENQLKNLLYSTSFLNKSTNADTSANASDQDFFARYKNTYGREATDFSAMAYEFVKVLAGAIKECGDNTTCIKTKVASLSDVSSSVGTLTMNENREVQLKEYSMYRVVDGKLVEVN